MIGGALLLATAFVGTAAGAETDDEDPICWVDAGTGGYKCEGERRRETRPNGPRLVSPTTTLGYDLLWVPELTAGPDGLCISTSMQDLGYQPTDMDQIQSERQFMLYLRGGHSMCPDAELPPASTPTLEAIRFLDEIGLPSPEPYIAPGRLPVGLDAYLETGAPTTRTYGPKATPFGDLTLTARAEIYVDWDDPHDGIDGEEGPFTGEPGPYPDGEITHLYQHHGTYDITVRYEWVADWSIGPHGGTIPGATTSGTYDGFEVYSRQAVG